MNPSLSDESIIAWIDEHDIKTEKGDPLSFVDHMFLYDIYRDMSPLQCIMKPAQIGASTMMNVKPYWMMDKLGVDIIYTLPADSDVVDFVGSKTNRIIAQNPIFQKLTADRDTIEQKQVGDCMIYYRGTWTKKAAMMIPADVLIHDEVDASKQDIISDYETRVKHSKFKWRWYFSHPSTEGVGVHKYWLLSDQKHWFITCPSCSKQQYLDWPDSIDQVKRCYVCKSCKVQISDDVRRRGRWVAKYKKSVKRPFSGYWISSLMCPWIPAGEIIDNFEQKDPEYFYTKVLGLPYANSDLKPKEDDILGCVNEEVNLRKSRTVMGVDTGIENHVVMGNQQGVFYVGSHKGYNFIEGVLKQDETSVAVFDQGGDLYKPRELLQKYPGRVYLCHYRRDRKTMSLITWGDGDEEGAVIVDRNRMIDMLLNEHRNRLITLNGTEEDYKPLWSHWDNIYAVKVLDQLGIERKEWQRKGPDHLVHASLYWRVGMDKFGFGDSAMTILPTNSFKVPTGVSVSLDNRIPVNKQIIMPESNETDDWRQT